ncbi:hypothetical protein [Paenibacillus sp.]|jgi:bla regulator protein BlaR1|uniref:hypothetical protein n=1 Tax=Paenibacillus sp. TaxID=58172 RepID=UPI00282D7D86|nr:hypothetical protein [Paenibacillus sp.]MDR0271180.1 hypothetical protein [Paenibacillus sp.]
MNVATKVAIATLSSVLLFGSSVNLVEAKSNKEAQEEAVKKAAEAAKSVPAEAKKAIENEENRLKELVKGSGDTYVMYYKYKQLNNGLKTSVYGLRLNYSSYKDYLKKASILKAPILQQPPNLPSGYKFSKAFIESPYQGKFFDDLIAEGVKSGKDFYTKKYDWKEAGKIELEYTDGKDELIINQYMADKEFAKLKGTEYAVMPDGKKYAFQYGTGKYYYGISTKSNMSKEKMFEILKAAMKK